MKLGKLIIIFTFLGVLNSYAQELVYKPLNPAFGAKWRLQKEKWYL